MYYQNISQNQSSSNPINVDYIPKPIGLYYKNVQINETISHEFLSTAEILVKLAKFENLKMNWLGETKLLSSLSDKFSHKSYLEIIDIGKDILPFIFIDLKNNDNFWFKALKEITGTEVVTKEIQGNFHEIKKRWLTWGVSKGYLKNK